MTMESRESRSAADGRSSRRAGRRRTRSRDHRWRRLNGMAPPPPAAMAGRRCTPRSGERLPLRGHPRSTLSLSQPRNWNRVRDLHQRREDPREIRRPPPPPALRRPGLRRGGPDLPRRRSSAYLKRDARRERPGFASRGRTFGSFTTLPASARPCRYCCRAGLPAAASSGRPLRPRRAPRGCATRSP
jgi:hypothetical protein